jgi:hypothetical protein
MSSERYVGERQALWHFLSELRPLVVAALGEDCLLRHHIDKALRTGDLDKLRQARRIFHNHPDALKRQLMRGIFEGTAPGAELPSPTLADGRLKPAAERAEGRRLPAPVIRFDAIPAAQDHDSALSVELAAGDGGAAPVRVLIKPGTLPSGAAEALRQIADWIENDRHILSRQHWAEQHGRRGPADETVDQA